MSAEARRLRAGDAVDDLCRACKILRRHTVMVASPEGVAIRVVCDYCKSNHAFRGGDRSTTSAAAVASIPRPVVREEVREGRPSTMSQTGFGDVPDNLESLLRRVIREEAGLTPVVPADKWRGGSLVLRPGRPGVQEKTWPIDAFFHKIVMLRNRLRVMEQQINATEIPADVKLKLQGSITGCYGTLTSFNLLFAEERDRFQGSGERED